MYVFIYIHVHLHVCMYKLHLLMTITSLHCEDTYAETHTNTVQVPQ